MQKIFLLLIIFSSTHLSNAQSNTRDSLQQLLQQEKSDSGHVLLLLELSRQYSASKPDSAMLLALKGLELSRRIGFPKGEAVSLSGIGNVYNVFGNYPKAMEVYLKALKIGEKMNDLQGIANSLNNIGNIHIAQGEYNAALEYYLKSKKLNEQLNDKAGLYKNLYNISRCYLGLKQYDSAKVYSP